MGMVEVVLELLEVFVMNAVHSESNGQEKDNRVPATTLRWLQREISPIRNQARVNERRGSLPVGWTKNLVRSTS